MPTKSSPTLQTNSRGACDICRLRKLKCDREDPSCTRCTNDNVPCTYYLFLNLPLPLDIQEFTRSRRLNGVRLARFKLERPLQSSQKQAQQQGSKLTIINYSPCNNENSIDKGVKTVGISKSKQNQIQIVKTKHTFISDKPAKEPNSLITMDKLTNSNWLDIKLPAIELNSPGAFFLITELSSKSVFGSLHHPNLLKSYSAIAPLFNNGLEQVPMQNSIDELLAQNVFHLILFYFKNLNTFHYTVYHKSFFDKWFENCQDSDFLTLVFGICALTCTWPNPPLNIVGANQLGVKYYELALYHLKKCYNKPSLTLFEALYILVDYEVKVNIVKEKKMKLTLLADLIGINLGIGKPSPNKSNDHRNLAWRIGEIHANAFLHIMGQSTTNMLYDSRSIRMSLDNLQVDGVLTQFEMELAVLHSYEAASYFHLVNRLDTILDRYEIRRGPSAIASGSNKEMSEECIRDLSELEREVINSYCNISSRLVNHGNSKILFADSHTNYYSHNLTLFYVTLLIEMNKSKVSMNAPIEPKEISNDFAVYLEEYRNLLPIDKCNKLNQLGLYLLKSMHNYNYMLIGSEYKWWCSMVIGTQFIYSMKLNPSKLAIIKSQLGELMGILEFYEDKSLLAKNASVPLKMILSSTISKK
ncbi:hypothetical protein CONCODRAFT_80492 [Conidiobolus coronatus NRRL 28638]|uniref:Zn(2)-C6 fungal-type domain-containing protein n=1 Tax=Conidiobolus coronatus (strain ATCC 28846 / CBS 209.66 / NRRL 28638) TaxID=796925 RepID=A0A137NUE5_CONC2|nr:hypothetical protein CONCODRAFT_80492 [Conidiobolus coronatus NRRL 28638]|eukprot:KXN66423.1 hypothetical protein CONCODRAFT_80492 [Conidiobolus coronatus NRRL 28638]